MDTFIPIKGWPGLSKPSAGATSLLSKRQAELGAVTQAFHLSIAEAEAGGFQAKLVCIVSSKIAKATWSEPVSKYT